MKATQRRKKSFYSATDRQDATSVTEKSVYETMRGDWRRIERACETTLNSANKCCMPTPINAGTR
jgi:hypothetical protein